MKQAQTSLPVDVPEVERVRSIQFGATAVRCDRGLMPADAEEFADVPPTEYRLFPRGEYKTYYIGESGLPVFKSYLVDDVSLSSIVAAFESVGNDIMIDYEHGNEFATGPDDGGRAAGWIPQLEIRDDGLYAVNVRWTDRAAELLRSREYRYRSPHFTYDPESMRVVALLDDSLVNTPGSVGITPLAAKRGDAATDGGANTNTSTETPEEAIGMDERITEALGTSDVDEAVAAVASMKATIETAQADSAKVKADLDASDALITDVMAAVACESRDGLVGAVKAAIDASAKVQSLTEEVETLRREKNEAEKAGLIEAGNFAADTREWLATQPLETVRSYCEKCSRTPEVPTVPQSAEAAPEADSAPEPWFVSACQSRHIWDEDKIRDEWKRHRAYARTHTAS